MATSTSEGSTPRRYHTAVWIGSDACSIVMDADKQANVAFHCELITIPPQTVGSSLPPWVCFDLEAPNGFQVSAPNGEAIFRAENSISLGSLLRVGDGDVFRVQITP
jgi:hypothetical protein